MMIWLRSLWTLDFKRRQISMVHCTISRRPMAGARLRGILRREDHEAHLGAMLHTSDHTCDPSSALDGQQSINILAVHAILAW